MVRDYITGYGSQIAIFGKEMNVTRDRQSCAQIKDNSYDKDQVKETLYGSDGHGHTVIRLSGTSKNGVGIK